MDIASLIPTLLPILLNWLFIGVIAFIAYRAYGHITKKIFQEIVDESIKKLDEKAKITNALRNLN